MDGGKLAGVISALAPAALALTKRFMVELPVHAALQWLTARVGHARFGPFVTEPLGAWSNLALFFAEPQDGAPARQKPLAAHTDRLNAQFCKPRWIEGARAQELSAALEVRRPCVHRDARLMKSVIARLMTASPSRPRASGRPAAAARACSVPA